MCQLAAYVGDRPIASLLLRAIENQEPLIGGHATGLGVIDEGSLRVEKDFGHVRRVMSTTQIASLEGTTGIAHTRHNAKSKDDPRYNAREMAHPFLDDKGTIALMHNGGIANYKEHWERLKENHTFSSYLADVDAITDSEVAVHMLSDALGGGASMVEGLRSLASQLTGTFLFGVITTEQPETVWIANWHQPCYVAVGEDEAMFCSSRIGFHDVREEFERIFEPPKNSIIELTRGRAEITPLDPERRAPNLRLNRSKLASSILEILKRTPKLEVRDLLRALNPDAFADALGVSPERVVEYRKAGVRFNNPYFEVLEMLVGDGMIREQIELKEEAGVQDMPKFVYSIV